jgi:hypothetical protein
MAKVWVDVRKTGYAVVLSGRTIRKPQRDYRAALCFIAGYIGESVQWAYDEERRVRDSDKPIGKFRYTVPKK